MEKHKILTPSIFILIIGLFMTPTHSMDLFTQITNIDQQHFSIQNASLYIEGTGFGSSQGTSNVYLGSYVLLIVEWSDTRIHALVPGGVPYGKHYDVCIKEGTSTISNTYDFLLLIWPVEVVPPTGYPGANIDIIGYQFGTNQGSKLLKIGSYSINDITSWSNSMIEAVVPEVPAGIYDIYLEEGGEVISRREAFRVYDLKDILVTWDTSGVWYRNSDTGSWVKITTPAYSVASGDLDGNGRDDLIGVWSNGLWVKYSSSGSWAKLASTLPANIASGDMDGDGRDDIIGVWPTSGVWYRNSLTGTWIKVSTWPANLVAAGDIDGDGADDLIGVWASGLWVKYSSSGSWAKLAPNFPIDIAAGDMNGDGREDVVGSWGSGVWYRNSMTGLWVKMSTLASLIAAGEMDGDGKDDLIGVWNSGLWVKYSSTMGWELITVALPNDIDAGLFRTGSWDVGAVGYHEPIDGYAEGPGSDGYIDLSDRGPGGQNFMYQVEDNLVPKESEEMKMVRTTGIGKPEFIYLEQKNLMPEEKKLKR